MLQFRNKRLFYMFSWGERIQQKQPRDRVACIHATFKILIMQRQKDSLTDTWVSCSAWSNRTLIMVGISFRWSLDNQMRIICLDLNYEEANSPGAPMAFQRSTEPYQVCCSYADCSFVPGRSHYVRMPFMVAEENASREKYCA